MKKITTIIVAIVMIVTSLTAFADTDTRLEIRSEDNHIPYADGQQFTRYTPWLKVLHPMSATEIANGNHGGEGSQQVRCIDISPVNSDLVFFGTDTTGVWKTENGGELWYNTNKNMIPENVASILCHPTNQNIVLAYQKDGGIYRSTDKGENWSLVLEDYLSSSRTDELFAYDNAGNIYAVTGRGIVKSTDSGNGWITLYSSDIITSASLASGASSIYVSNDGMTIIAAYKYVEGFSLSGLYVSLDGGNTWSVKNATEYGAYAIAVDPSKASRWFVSFATNSNISQFGFYVTNDSGNNWSSIKSGDTDVPIVQARIANDKLYITYSQRGQNLRYVSSSLFNYITSSLIDWNIFDVSSVGSETFRGGSNMYFSQGFDFSGDIMYMASGSILKSVDKGQTFVNKSSGFSGLNVNHFNMDQNGKIIMSICDVGVAVSDSNYTTSNIPTFTRTNAAITTMSVTDPEDSKHIIAWDGASNTAADKVLGIIESTDGGVTFGEQKANTNATSNPVVMQYDEDDSDIIYTSHYTSRDNGATWTANEYFIIAISDNRMMAWDKTKNKYMYSQNKGETWKELGNAGNEPCGFFDATDSNVFWYKQLYDFGTINLTTGGKTSYKLKTPYRVYSQIVANPNNPNHILLSCKGLESNTYSPSLYESIDHGNTWHVVPGFFGVRSMNENSMRFSTTTNEVFISSASGIYVYEYKNFDYYSDIRLKIDESTDEGSIYTTVEQVDGCIVAPQSPFKKTNKKFWGWLVDGKVYFEKEAIPVN